MDDPTTALAITPKPKRLSRKQRDPEFWAKVQRVRRWKIGRPKVEAVEKIPEPTLREKASRMDGTVNLKRRIPVQRISKQHSMVRDRRTQCWRVRVPGPDGKTRYVTTGQTDLKEALKVVDRSGVQQLSLLARVKGLTQTAAAIIMADAHKTCEEVMDAWLTDLKLDASEATFSMYRIYVNSLLQQCGCAKQPMSAITRDMLYNFVNEAGSKCSTRSLRLAAINSFYRHASGFGYVVGNIATTIKINLSSLTVEQREKEAVAAFTEEEYRKVVGSEQVPRFWRIATTLGYWLGLRMVDVCKLERASLGPDFAVLYPQKNERRLILPIHDPLIGGGELKDLFAQLLAATPEDQLLCFPLQSQMYDNHRRTLIGSCRGAYDSVGVGKTFHGLRHAFKVRLMASGKTLEEIRDLMGHASVVTTREYGRAIPPTPPPSPGAEAVPGSVPEPPASSAQNTVPLPKAL